MLTRRQWSASLAGVVIASSATLVPATATTAAPNPTPGTSGKQVDATLGNGLGRLVAESERPSFKRQSAQHVDQSTLAIRDAQNRVLIQLTAQEGVDRAAFRKQAESLGLVVRNVDAEHGTLEGFTPLSAVHALAALRGTGTISQSIKPATNLGKATSQGVALERIDKVQGMGIDGKGITLGALSDSYDTAETDAFGDPLTVRAAQDVKSGDLPGKGNPRNSKPVVVIEDGFDPAWDSDEGRAMLQIAHDVAPASKLCFATANTGVLGFADNIRRLADKKGSCGADVIVDDIRYYEEPMFSDGPLSDAVDEVAAKGVHYFSSAGNDGLHASWNSPVKLIPAKTGLKGTNLDLTGVDPALYDGGLQDMDPGSGSDVAQDVTVGELGGLFNLQWDDPVDVDGAKLGTPIFTASGEINPADPEPSFTFTPTAAQVGRQVRIRTDAIPSGETDLVLTVDAPDGSNVASVDTGSSPEVLVTTLDQAGPYTITVSGFDGDTGDFTVDIAPVVTPSKVTTDFNVLFFDKDGNYAFNVADLNTVTGKPSELASLVGPDQLQMVIARHGTGPVKATRLRNVLANDMFFTEYAESLSPAIYGHATAKGATAVAAYDGYRPFLPNFFTSPGGDLPIFFDSDGNRLSKPQVRRVPQVAGADAANTTFFGADDPRDPDTQPNFNGTSAAAPHAAAIAALTLQKAGGPKALSPAALRARLQGSTYKHDLDPSHSAGGSKGLTITADGTQGYETRTVPGPMNDPRFFTLKYDGAVPLKSVTFFGETASPTALGKRRPPYSDGIVFDPRPFDGETPFRSDGFPFTVGGTSGGLAANEVAASFSVPGGGESVAGQFRRMTLKFQNTLKGGQGLQFGVDRDLAISGFGGSNEGNGADELGGATFLPQDKAIPFGMAFVARRADGTRIYGLMTNRIGPGWTPLDGYGLVNAEKAVLGR